jgi:hypothetical protein
MGGPKVPMDREGVLKMMSLALQQGKPEVAIGIVDNALESAENLIMQALEQIDLAQPEVVEVNIRHDAKVLWVNVDGVCRFRVCNIKKFILDDMRPVDINPLLKQEKRSRRKKAVLGENDGFGS